MTPGAMKEKTMRRGGGQWAIAMSIAMLGLVADRAAPAQGVGFLTEQQRLASYCTGVFEARMRDLNDFIKVDCAGPRRKECDRAADELGRAQIMDRRLWAYLTRDIFASKDQGPRERALAYAAMTKGGDDWAACKRHSPQADADRYPACREPQGCLDPARFQFLPP